MCTRNRFGLPGWNSSGPGRLTTINVTCTMLNRLALADCNHAGVQVRTFVAEVVLLEASATSALGHCAPNPRLPLRVGEGAETGCGRLLRTSQASH